MNTGNLTVTTPTDRTIEMTRVFDAPKHLVFQAMTTPELWKRWFKCMDMVCTEAEIDFRVGGKWRWVMQNPAGQTMSMNGVYREIVPNERFVATECFPPHPGESVNTLTFVEKNGKTTFTITCEYPSQEVRDIVIKSGMEHGAAETYDNLNALLIRG